MKEIFKGYPGLEKLKISDRFPYDERPQFGLVVKNTSYSTLPLAADNFIATIKSYVFSAGLKGKKNLLLDWVKENPATITKFIKDDLTAQISANNLFFTLNNLPVEGSGNLNPATSDRQINIYVNNLKVKTLGYENQKIILEKAPVPGDEVRAEYYIRNLIQPGYYYFEMLSAKEVAVDPLYLFDQIIIPEATGYETNYTLPFPVHANSLEFVEGDRLLLTRGVHYTISGQILTFLPNPNDPLSGKNLRTGQSYRAIYRHQGATLGIFDVKQLHTTEILPGVTTAFSYFLETGDKQVVIVTEKREDVANEFGGHFETSLTLDVYSRDPIQREIVADLLIVKIFGELKPIFDHSGLMIVSANISGESEPVYDENTDNVYYTTSIDIQLTTDWRLYSPLLPKIKYFDVDIEAVESLTNFKVSFIPGKENYR